MHRHGACSDLAPRCPCPCQPHLIVGGRRQLGIRAARPATARVDCRPEEHWPFEAAIRTRRPVVSDCSKIIEGFEQFEPFTGDRFPTAVVVLPRARDAEEGFPNVVCVLGLSRPHVPFSADAEGFIHNLRIQMASFLDRTMSQRTDQSIIQQLYNSDKAKNQLLSNIANEIMSPVGLLSGLLDDLKQACQAERSAPP